MPCHTAIYVIVICSCIVIEVVPIVVLEVLFFFTPVIESYNKQFIGCIKGTGLPMKVTS